MSGLTERDLSVLGSYARDGNRELYWNYLSQLPGADGTGHWHWVLYAMTACRDAWRTPMHRSTRRPSRKRDPGFQMHS